LILLQQAASRSCCGAMLLSHGHMTDGGIDSWRRCDTTSCEAHVDFYVREHATWCPRWWKKDFMQMARPLKKDIFLKKDFNL
jgi:hypothetical protein